MNAERARDLRANMTDPERKLWHRLRRRNLSGVYFRRQAPIGPYIADFVCFERKLIVEVDGGQHSVRIDYDEKRSAFLRSEGFRVLRFWNNDVMGNIDGVVAEIVRVLEASRRWEKTAVTRASPSLRRSGGRGG
jgi:very-short-patch-repair endonuclease